MANGRQRTPKPGFAPKPETNESEHVENSDLDFSDTTTVSVEATESAPAAPALTPTGKAKKTRTPVETRLSAMNRAEKAVYYTKRRRTLDAQVKALCDSVGPEAIELAGSL